MHPCDTPALRQELLVTARGLTAAGLNRGTAGNASLRCGDGMLITPTGIKAEETCAADLVFVDGAGQSQGALAPSSEWRFHLDIYRHHPDAGAVVHAHSPHATALACQGREIPPFHYMIARFGGDSLRCAAYATFGTQALSDRILAALAGRCACLLANHGMLAYGRNGSHALDLAIELESLCQQFLLSSQMGPPRILPADEMARVIERFASYGQRRAQDET